MTKAGYFDTYSDAFAGDCFEPGASDNCVANGGDDDPQGGHDRSPRRPHGWGALGAVED